MVCCQKMKGRGGAGPLHLLAGSFSPEGHSATRVLLERGEDPNRKDVDGLTPVHVAAVWGNFETLRLFLLAGGNPEMRDAENMNALDYALQEGQLECLKMMESWRVASSSPCVPLRAHQSLLSRPSPQACNQKVQPCDGVDITPKTWRRPKSRSGTKGGVTLSCCSPFLTMTFCSKKSSQRSDSPPYITAEEDFSSVPNGAVQVQAEEDLSSICTRVRRSIGFSDNPEKVDDLEESVRTLEDESKTEMDSGILAECAALTPEELRKGLTERGIDVGPITGNTRWLYIRRLATLGTEEKNGHPGNADARKYSPELNALLAGNVSLKTAKSDEEILERFFDESGQRNWREGRQKMSFCYLLLDSTLTQNLPERSKSMSYEEAVSVFLGAIFYIGKGKKSRPYQHLLEAAEVQQEGHRITFAGVRKRSLDSVFVKGSEKTERILELWEGGKGVVSVHVFHNIIPVEAYTKEAAMIDAIGIHNLTNVKRGDYYGLASGWTSKRRRSLGVFLLDKALNIFLLEGERQLFIRDIVRE